MIMMMMMMRRRRRSSSGHHYHDEGVGLAIIVTGVKKQSFLGCSVWGCKYGWLKCFEK